MTKIRKIIEKYAPIDGYLAIHGFKADDCKIIHYEDFDKLEKELIEHYDKEELKKYLKKVKNKCKPDSVENDFPYSMGYKAGQYKMIKKINKKFKLGL